MRRLALAAAVCLSLAGPARADGTAADRSGETLSGDWGGARSAAAARGIAFEGLARLDALRNRGALGNGSRHVTHLDLKLGIDLGTLAGWNGASAMINVLSNGGWGPNARFVGSQFGVTNIEVGAPTTTRVFQLWLQQSLLDDRLALLAGLYPIDSEFFAMESAGVFLGPHYGTPGDLALTRGPSIFNSSAFGIRARWEPADGVYAMGAVLDGIPNDPARPKSTAIRFASGDGSFSIGEIGWQPAAGGDRPAGPAKLALGLWGYSARVDDQRDTDAAGNPIRRRQSGGYLLGERTLLPLGAGDDRHVAGFARFTWTDGDSTALENSLNLGLRVKGPLAARPDDILGLAWSRGGISRKWRDAQAVPATTAASEDTLEITWRFAVTPWLALQPNYQSIRRPGGTTRPDARLIGIRVDLAL